MCHCFSQQACYFAIIPSPYSSLIVLEGCPEYIFVVLYSGDLPQATSHVSLSAEMLHEAQFMACNASGICAGVDASAMPKITAISVGPDGSVQSVRDILR